MAVSLFHPSKAVRDATVELFKRLEAIQVRPHVRTSSVEALMASISQLGSGFLKNLNFFLYLAFNRQLEQSGCPS